MAVKTSAIKKYTMDEVAEAQKKIHDQYKTKMETAQKEYETSLKTPTFVANAGKDRIEDLKAKADQAKADYEKMFGKDGLKKPREKSILNRGTVGSKPVEGFNASGNYTSDVRTKPTDVVNDSITEWYNGKPVYPQNIAERQEAAGKKINEEIDKEKQKVGKEAAGPREDPFNDFVNGEIERELNEKMEKLGSNKRATAKDIENAIKVKEKVDPNFRKQYEKAFYTKKRSEEMATKYLTDNGMEITPENIQSVIQSQNLTKLAEIENQEEEERNAKRNAEKVDMQAFGAYGSTAANAHNGIAPPKTPEDEAKEKAKEDLQTYNRRRNWERANIAMNLIGAGIRGGFGISNTILNTTQKMFNAFTSKHPMSAASQAFVAATSGVAELSEVFKDMDKTYGFTNPDDPHSKGILMGTIKGAKYYKDREEAQGVAYDWMKQFNDEIDALGVADPTQLTNDQTRQILNNMSIRMAQQLSNLKQKDTMNKWNMQHGSPDAMTIKEKTELRLLSSFDTQIRGELQLLNRIEKAQQGPEFQAAYEALQQASGVAPLPPATVNNVASIEPNFELEETFIKSMEPDIDRMKNEKAATGTHEYDMKIKAFDAFVATHKMNKDQIKIARDEKNNNLATYIKSNIFAGMPQNIDGLNYDQVEAAQRNFDTMFSNRWNTLDTKSTTLNVDEDFEYGLLSKIKDDLIARKRAIPKKEEYDAKQQSYDDYQQTLSNNNITPIEVGNFTAHMMAAGMSGEDYRTLVYNTMKNNVNSQDIDSIGLEKPEYIIGKNGEKYARPLKSETRNYSKNIGDLIDTIKQSYNDDPDEFKRRANCSDEDIKRTIAELEKYHTELNNYADMVSRNNQNLFNDALFPDDRFHIPPTWDEFMTGSWEDDKNNHHSLRHDLLHAKEDLELKSHEPGFNKLKQLQCINNTLHMLDIYDMKKTMIDRLRTYRYPQSYIDEKVADFENKCKTGGFIVNYTEDTLTPDDLRFQTPGATDAKGHAYQDNFKRFMCEELVRQIDEYKKSPKREANEKLFGIISADKIDVFTKNVTDVLKRGMDKATSQQIAIIEKLATGQKNEILPTISAEVGMFVLTPEYEQINKNTMKALGLTKTKLSSEQKGYVDALSYSLSQMYDTFFSANDSRFNNDRFINLMGSIMTMRNDKSKKEAVEKYIKGYATKPAGLLKDKLKEVASEYKGTNIEKAINNLMIISNTSQKNFASAEKLYSALESSFTPTTDEEKTAMIIVKNTIDQFYRDKKYFEDPKNVKKLTDNILNNTIKPSRIFSGMSMSLPDRNDDDVVTREFIKNRAKRSQGKTPPRELGDFLTRTSYLILNGMINNDLETQLKTADRGELEYIRRHLELLNDHNVKSLLDGASNNQKSALMMLYKNKDWAIREIDKVI